MLKREDSFYCDTVSSLDPWAGDPDGNKLLLDSFGKNSERGNGAFMEDEALRKGDEMWQDTWGADGESGRPYRYDVFLSFRGEDTLNGFAGHLHAALDQRGIATFMDEELRKGEEIVPAILGAIGGVEDLDVVFSENYASSSWCLDELVRIVECRDTMGQMVCPVFYKVDPSDVRKQRRRYERALIDHEERLKSNGGDPEKVKRWREALTAAANISGWHLVDHAPDLLAGDPDGNELRLDSFGESSQRGNGAFVEDEVLRKGKEMRQDSQGAIGESGRPYKYDVFLSFRGEDTRNGFTGHLHAALDQRGIDAFMDEEELRQGEEIAPAILGAIGESRISIVMFSENYASSSWCLDELVRIMECGDTMGQMVCPVFYKVDPSDVRNQRGRYGEALIHHEERLKSNSSDPKKVKRWREALTAAANISGWHLVDQRESYVIKNIVERVCAQLKNRKQLHVPENVVAMDSHVHRMRTLLDMESNEVCMVGICGFGGIGKTTIAKATYNAFEHKFEYCSFLSNVRETCEESADSGLLKLQEALIPEVRWCDGLKLGSVDEGMSMTKSRLCKKVLIVLDDVNQLIQLETLVGGHDWFGDGSRIIITTRDEHLLAAHHIKSSMYKVQPLDRLSAHTLFKTIVFPNSSPCLDYEELSYNIVEYTKGLPLAVKVLGSFLRGKKLPIWKSTLDKLKEVFNGDIFSVLRMSFDGLDDYEKGIFLDIACFFKGENKSYVRNVLKSCDLYPDVGIEVLLDKSLITIDHGKLEMHDMIQEMGREIIRKESPKEPGERSRLWFYKDVLHVLTEGTGTSKVEAIMIKLAAPEEVHFSTQAFTNMRRLRIFLACNVYHTGDPVYFPTELRWLEWPDYYPTSVPLNTGHGKLVGLDLSKSTIRLLGKTFELCRNLKFVNFSHCTLLSEIPDVSSLPNLESLILQECINLVEVHQSPGHLDKLEDLNFLNCYNLSRFPRNLKSRSLQNLILSGCSKLSRFPDILVQMKHLTELALHGTAIRELPSSVANLVELKGLYLEDCTDLKSLPCSIYTLQHLERILVDGCSQVSKLPKCLCESSDCTNFSLPLALPSVINLNVQRCSLSELSFLKNLHCMSSLTILDLSENKFVSLPTCISQFTKLQQFFLIHCKQLQEILALPPNITSLHAKGCESLEICVDLSNMLQYNSDESPWLRRFDFSDCHKLIQDQCSSNCNMLSIEGLLGETRVDIFHPGSKIPTWFVHQSIEGLIKFHVSSELYCDIAGLAFCAIVGSTNRKEASISCEIQLFVNKEATYGCVDCFSSLELDHVWVLYVPRRMMWGLDAKLVNCRNQFAVLFEASEGTLRSCGVHLVYKQGKQPNDMKIDESIDPQNSNANLTSSYVETRKRKERFSDS